MLPEGGDIEWREGTLMTSRRLTTRFIDSIKPPNSGRVEYWDATVTGLGLRVSESGRKSWVLMYRHQRRLRRLTLGTYPVIPLAKAREMAGGALREVVDGQDPAAIKKSERDADTFGELAERYIERYAKQRKRSWKEDRRALDRDLLPRFGHRKATDINRREVIACLDEIKARGAPILANRTLEIIRRIYNWGIAQELVEANPAVMIERPGEETRRDRVLSDGEIRAVWKALDDGPLRYDAKFKLMFLTAQRPGEVRQMRWSDIDEDTAWWTIPAKFSKNRLAHQVPLISNARTLLKKLDRVEDCDWVFPSPIGDKPIGSYAKALARIRNASGVEFWAHDIRRTVATRLTGDLGISRLVVGRILNHAEVGVISTYDRHSYNTEKRQALEAWGQRLKEILTSQSSNTSNVVEISKAGS